MKFLDHRSFEIVFDPHVHQHMSDYYKHNVKFQPD